MIYRIFNLDRAQWWKPAAKGYTADLAEAGTFSQDEACWQAADQESKHLRPRNVVVVSHEVFKAPEIPALAQQSPATF